MPQRCRKLSCARVYPGVLASPRGRGDDEANPLYFQRIPWSSREIESQARTRDTYVTSEVLYQLSYVGACRDFPDFPPPQPDFRLRGACKILVGRCSGQA